MMTSNEGGSLQASSLSTLIGYITGPKAEQPVGVRVVEPPSGTRQKQRGNLYAVVDLYGDRPDRDVIADHLLTLIQRTYYSAKGSQSHVMIEAVRRAHQVLHEINLRNPDSALRTGVLCAALLNGRLVVVASGPAMALIRVNDQVQMFPSELRMDQDAGPDGEAPMQIFRQNLARDDVMFLGGSSWLSLMPIKALGGIVAFTNADNCADAADELYAYGGEISPPGLLIVLVEDSDAPQPAPPTLTPSPTQQTKSGPSKFLGLPTALGAKPPARTPATAAVATAALSSTPSVGAVAPQVTQPAAVDQAVADATSVEVEEAVAPSDAEALRDDASDADDAYQAAAVAAAVVAHEVVHDDGQFGVQYAEEADAIEKESGPTWSDKMTAVAAAGLVQTKRFLTRMLPDSSKADAKGDGASSDETDGSEEEADESHRHQQAFVAAAVGKSAYPPTEFDDLPPDEEKYDTPGRIKSPPPPLPEMEPYIAPAPATGMRARLFVLAALLILILVPSVVAAVNWREGEVQRRQAEELTMAASAKISSAEAALSQEDPTQAGVDLADAQNYLTEAITLDGSNAERNALAGRIEQLMQDLLQVQPLYALTTPLLTFPADARPSRVLVADSSIYVLDSGQQLIQRYSYDPSADAVTDTRPQVVLRQGDVIDGATVGTLSDMAWMPLIPGVEDKATLLILDRNNNLFSYDPRVEGARLMALPGQDQWRSLSQVQTFNGRTYLADEGANEIYRYTPGAEDGPEMWFSDDTLVNLAGTLAMEIDGDIWLLLSSGNIMRYRTGPAGGEQLPFTLENTVGTAQEPVDMYVTREDRAEIYVADAGEDRILVYNKDGAYTKQLRAAEGDPLQGLSGIFIDEIGERLFILTSSSLYSHPLL